MDIPSVEQHDALMKAADILEVMFKSAWENVSADTASWKSSPRWAREMMEQPEDAGEDDRQRQINYVLALRKIATFLQHRSTDRCCIEAEVTHRDVDPASPIVDNTRWQQHSSRGENAETALTLSMPPPRLEKQLCTHATSAWNALMPPQHISQYMIEGKRRMQNGADAWYHRRRRGGLTLSHTDRDSPCNALLATYTHMHEGEIVILMWNAREEASPETLQHERRAMSSKRDMRAWVRELCSLPSLCAVSLSEGDTLLMGPGVVHTVITVRDQLKLAWHLYKV